MWRQPITTTLRHQVSRHSRFFYRHSREGGNPYPREFYFSYYPYYHEVHEGHEENYKLAAPFVILRGLRVLRGDNCSLVALASWLLIPAVNLKTRIHLTSWLL